MRLRGADTAALVASAVLLAAAAAARAVAVARRRRRAGEEEEWPSLGVLACIRARRSVFPRDYVDRAVPMAVVDSLLAAAMWAPFHGPRPPWRFVVLGRESMVEMQRLTLSFYDSHWREEFEVGKPGVQRWKTMEEYSSWRDETEEEITGRWGPVSAMIAICMRRQPHPERRMPKWEEAASTACAVQNMHIQAAAYDGLACYWSSWHDGARDSHEMRSYLGLGAEDECMGFFIVAACLPGLKDRRRRDTMIASSVEKRP